jgi:cell division topological specificity factor
MSILNFFTRGRSSAPVARERLQVLLAHERALTGGADLAAVLKQEILEVIARHMPIDRDRVMVKLDRGDQVSTLEIDIEMPDTALAAGAAAAAPARRRRTAQASRAAP